MNIFAFCVVILSSSFSVTSLPSLPVPLANKPGPALLSLNTPLRPWPPVPYKVPLSHRKGHQYILITQSDAFNHGDRARSLALSVCTRMIEWLQRLPPGSLIDKRHWEQQSYGPGPVAEEFSIFLDLNPPDVHTDHDSGYLDREQAYFALLQFKTLVADFGAMTGAFEVHVLGFRRAVCKMHVFTWPAGIRAGGSSRSSSNRTSG
ncbi:MAG: hypothetical protein Q9198_008807 [Flavoplaca austrocitrina]